MVLKFNDSNNQKKVGNWLKDFLKNDTIKHSSAGNYSQFFVLRGLTY